MRYFPLLVLAVAFSAHAQVHRCVSAQGAVSYSDSACDARAVRSDRVLGRNATEMRWEPDGYRLQEQLDASDRLSRQYRGPEAPAQTMR